MRPLTVMLLISFVILPVKVQALVDELVFAGKGEVHYLGFIKLYSAELYVDEQITREMITSPDHSKCLVLSYDVSISAKDIIRGANAVLERQHPEETLNRLKTSIDLIHSHYQDVKDGDSYSLCYDAKWRSTTLSFNGEKVVAIDSIEFANLYFGIWLGPKAPLDESLRDSLLASLK